MKSHFLGFLLSINFLYAEVENKTMKIAIIGMPGSGKSTLALELAKKLSLPVYHLDQYFWKPGWVEPDRAEFAKIHNGLCDRNQWIIDGCALRFFEYRIQKADVIIFIDISCLTAFYRVFKRLFENYGKEYFASAKGCPEQGPTLKFLKYIWNFNTTQRPEIMRLLDLYKDTKKIIVIKSQADYAAIERFLQ
jgi:adenylate kinase family enzyme